MEDCRSEGLVVRGGAARGACDAGLCTTPVRRGMCPCGHCSGKPCFAARLREIRPAREAARQGATGVSRVARPQTEAALTTRVAWLPCVGGACFMYPTRGLRVLSTPNDTMPARRTFVLPEVDSIVDCRATRGPRKIGEEKGARPLAPAALLCGARAANLRDKSQSDSAMPIVLLAPCVQACS